MNEKDTRRKRVEEFRFYCFWLDWPDDDRWNDTLQKYELTVKKEKDVLLAVNKAYYDMTPRTIKNFGLKKITKDDSKKLSEIKNENLKEIKERLAKEISGTFKEQETDFNTMCKSFLDRFNKLIETLNKQISNEAYKIECIEYGKAQKIVNMTYKYLLLFDDAFDDENMEIFSLRHMAVDSFIIKQIENLEGESIHCTWSNMTEMEYSLLEEKIKKHLKANEIPIFKEFDWWREETSSK